VASHGFQAKTSKPRVVAWGFVFLGLAIVASLKIASTTITVQHPPPLNQTLATQLVTIGMKVPVDATKVPADTTKVVCDAIRSHPVTTGNYRASDGFPESLVFGGFRPKISSFLRFSRKPR